MSGIDTHKQTWVKVNAPVDEGITNLIEALSAFPKLMTTDSCEGGYKRSSSDNEGMPAVVFFQYGQDDHSHTYQELADFVLGYLGPGLIGEMGDLVAVKLHIFAKYRITAELAVRPGAMARTVRILRRLRREFEDQPPKVCVS